MLDREGINKTLDTYLVFKKMNLALYTNIILGYIPK